MRCCLPTLNDDHMMMVVFTLNQCSATKGTYHNCMRRSLQTVALYEANRW